jgi:hypothetical protein
MPNVAEIVKGHVTLEVQRVDLAGKGHQTGRGRCGRPKPGRHLNASSTPWTHYENRRRELRRTFDALGLAA